MVSKPVSVGQEVDRREVERYKSRLRSTLGLFNLVLRQPPSEFEDLVQAAQSAEFSVEEPGPGGWDLSDGDSSSVSAADCWRLLQGRRWWALEKQSMVAIASSRLVMELFASHMSKGGVCEELQWVCRNLGNFVGLHRDLLGPVVAGLASAAEELEERGTPLPEYLAKMLKDSVGQYVEEPLGSPFG